MNPVTLIPSFLAAAALAVSSLASAQVIGQLNAPQTVAQAFYQDYSAAFERQYPQATGVATHHSNALHSSREAARVTFNTTTDLQTLADLGVVAPDWAQRLPSGMAPTRSPVLFVVRPGNPKQIRDWNDLARADVRVVLVHPKAGAAGRYAYLGAWGSVRDKGGSDADAAEFVAQLYRNAPQLVRTGREAVAAFGRKGRADVLVAFESEVAPLKRQWGAQAVEAVYPSVSIAADNPVALIAHGAEGVAPAGPAARAYLEFFYSDEAQDIAARHGIRPRSTSVLARHADVFKPIRLFGIETYFGNAVQAQQTHFAQGARFDQFFDQLAGRGSDALLAQAGQRVR